MKNIKMVLFSEERFLLKISFDIDLYPARELFHDKLGNMLMSRVRYLIYERLILFKVYTG